MVTKKKAVVKKTSKKTTKPKTAKATASHCEIVVVLDRSGSMANIRNDMENGYNTFIAEQKKLTGTCNVTLVQFDSLAIETVYQEKPLADVPNLVFVPRSSTPLLDAMGKTLSETKLRVKDKNTKVIFMVITDGYENASVEWKREQIKKLVEECTANGWLFQFLGANIDSFGEANTLGIRQISTMNYDASAKGVASMYAASAGSAIRYRSSTSTGEELLRESAFTDEERKNASTDAK